MSYTSITPGGEPASGPSLTGCLLWFIGGISLSFMAIFSLVALVLLAASVALNVYLGWRLSGMEIVITQATPQAPQVIIATATLPAQVAVQPPGAALPVDPADSVDPAPSIAAGDETPAPTVTATPLPPQVEVEAQLGTVAAIATQQAGESDSAAAFAPPPATPTPVAGAVPINPGGAGVVPSAGSAPADTPVAQPAAPPTSTPVPPAAPLESANQENQASTDPVEENREQVRRSQAEPAALSSSNAYTLITIEGERESRPAAEHGDLNLKLREPQPIDAAPELVDIDGSGIDPNTPKFNKVFDPNFSATYTIHNWDWGCNCKGDLVQDDKTVLVGIDTQPGQPIYIPPRESDIFGGDYYATVLYADENSLTFVYSRVGNVVKGYTVHYLGLETDPNLVALFRESKGRKLPGLTLDTPVGRATDELIVAIRDNGTFMDMRSRRDWWE